MKLPRLSLPPPIAGRSWLAVIPVAVALLLAGTDVLERWNGIAYDVALRNWRRAPPDAVVIVAIDPESLDSLGRWPWPRTVHAQLLHKLREAGARAVGMDILFAEPDRTDPLADAGLAEAMAGFGRVVLPVAPDSRTDGRLTTIGPIDVLARSAARGHVDVELEADGIVRAAWLDAGPPGQQWPTFPLALLRTVAPGYEPHIAGERHVEEGTDPGGRWLRNGRVLVPFYGGAGSFPQVSYASVLAGDRATLARLGGKYVLVGATAGGLGEAFATPVSPRGRPMSGIELHAHVLGNLLQHSLVTPLGRGWQMLLAAALALLPVLVLPYCRPRWALAATGAMLLLVFACSGLLLVRAGIWSGPWAAAVAVLSAYPVWSWRRLEATLRALREERGRIRATLQAIGEGVITTDREGRIQYLNPVAETLTGWTATEARGLPMDQVIDALEEADRRPVQPPLHDCVVNGRSVRPPQHFLLRDRGQRERTIRWSANPIRDGLRISGMVLALSDVTEARALNAEMLWQATHDALTGLPNRTLLLDRLDKAVARARRTRRCVAVLFIDLDGFKKVNDAYGHASGDALLTEAAERIRASSRDEDTIARWGGDEFVVVLEKQEGRESVEIAARKLLESLSRPFRALGSEIYITGSIGISLYPMDGEDVAGLLKRADAAMYRAKDEGRNELHFFSRDLSDRAVERLSLERDLWSALRRDELILHYQPKVSMRDGRIVGAEALLRWPRPGHGFVPPDQFIPVAEQSDLIHALGDWVLHAAFRQLAVWQRDHFGDFTLAVNLAPAQLVRRDLVERIQRALHETGADASGVVLEISENLFLKEPVMIAEMLRSLHATGMRVAIDDFGTGHSSIGHLKRLPIDQVKIDISFVRPLANGPDEGAIVRGMIALAHSLRLSVVAEGVENERQYRVLQELLCDEVQGHYLSRAVSAEDFALLARTWDGVAAGAGGDAASRMLH